MSPDQVMSDPANTMMPPDGDQKPLVEQVEEERADEDRETFITESGLVEEVEEEDAKVGCASCDAAPRQQGEEPWFCWQQQAVAAAVPGVTCRHVRWVGGHSRGDRVGACGAARVQEGARVGVLSEVCRGIALVARQQQQQQQQPQGMNAGLGVSWVRGCQGRTRGGVSVQSQAW
jgi:hypothetical protein